MGLGKAGFELDRAAELLDGLVISSLVYQGDAKIGISQGVPRIEANRPAVFPDGQIVFPLGFQSEPQIAMGAGVGGTRSTVSRQIAGEV